MKFDEAKHASVGFGMDPYFQRIPNQPLRILAKFVAFTVVCVFIGWLGAQVINWLVDLSE